MKTVAVEKRLNKIVLYLCTKITTIFMINKISSSKKIKILIDWYLLSNTIYQLLSNRFYNLFSLVIYSYILNVYLNLICSIINTQETEFMRKWDVNSKSL